MITHRLLAVLALLGLALPARADEPAPAAIVKAMAQIGFCTAPVFSQPAGSRRRIQDAAPV